MEKILTIRLDKIKDIIKKIESFSEQLKSFIEVNFSSENTSENNKNIDLINNTQINEGDLSIFRMQSRAEFPINDRNYEYHSQISEFILDKKKNKKLKILIISYIQNIIFLLLVFVMILPLVYLIAEILNRSKKIIDSEVYLYEKLIESVLNTAKIKLLMSNSESDNDVISFDILIEKIDLNELLECFAYFPDLMEFYNEKFMSNLCAAAYYKNEDKELYNTCMNDELIKTINNTESLIQFVDQSCEQIIKIQNINMNNAEIFDNLTLFSSDYFKNLEKAIYLYISPVTTYLEELFSNSLEKFLRNKFNDCYAILISLFFIILGFCGFVYYYYINKLIHLLSVSRCIFKIIPTIVINNTQDLANWIENKY